MTSGLFDPEGGADPHLTGVESRTLRALLQLERRHIAILADIVTGEDTNVDRVVNWERSKGRGYPAALVVILRDMEGAVSELGGVIALTAERAGGDRLIIRRPHKAPEIIAALRLEEVAGLRLSSNALGALNEGGGDFWQRLCDAATASAATMLGNRDNRPIHVEYLTPAH